jgi:hypothetical protein
MSYSTHMIQNSSKKEQNESTPFSRRSRQCIRFVDAICIGRKSALSIKLL